MAYGIATIPMTLSDL